MPIYDHQSSPLSLFYHGCLGQVETINSTRIIFVLDEAPSTTICEVAVISVPDPTSADISEPFIAEDLTPSQCSQLLTNRRKKSATAFFQHCTNISRPCHSSQAPHQHWVPLTAATMTILRVRYRIPHHC